MRTREVTLKDIARAVGKSVATVSKSLRDHADIAPETRYFIQEKAKEMGYSPNITARRLQKKRTDAIGLILPLLSDKHADPFFTELLSGIADEAARHNFDLLVSTRSPGEQEETAYRRLASERRADGVIIAQPRRQDWRIEFLTTQNIPFILVGHQNPQTQHAGVWINTKMGITQAMSHLNAEGRTRTTLIAPPKSLCFAESCITAFYAAAQNRHPENNRVEYAREMSQKEGYRITQNLLATTPHPDSILACHDLMAMGAMKAIQDQGFEVGDDIAVIGFGDILLAEYSQPPLTTVHRPTHILGQQACKNLLRHIETGEVPKDIISDPWLVLRQSSSLAFWM